MVACLIPNPSSIAASGSLLSTSLASYPLWAYENNFAPSGGVYSFSAKCDASSTKAYSRIVPVPAGKSACETAPSTTAHLLNNVILVPAELDAGNIVSDQTHSGYLWFFFDSSPPTLNGVSSQNADGTLLSFDSIATPYTPLPYETVDFTVNVSLNGPPLLDGIYTFDITGYQNPVLRITGLRIKAFDFVPDWSQPHKEMYEWKTYTMTAIDGTEQRSAIRPDPLMRIQAGYLVHSSTRQKVENLLREWQDRTYLVPLWQYHRTLGADIVAGSKTVVFAEGLVEHFNKQGDYAVIVGTDGSIEILTHEVDDGVNTVTTAYELSADWPKGSEVYPAKIVYAQRSVKETQLSPDISRITMDWEAAKPEVRVASELPGPTTPAGDLVFDLWPKGSNKTGSASFTKRFTDIRFESSAVLRDILADKKSQTVSYEFVATFEKEAVDFLKWAFARKGKQKAIYAPTFRPDLHLAVAIPNGSLSFKVHNAGYSKGVFSASSPNYIYFKTKKGNFVFEVTQAQEDVDPALEVITVGSAFSTDLELHDIEYISIVEPRRLSSDTFTLIWLRRGLCRISFNLETV